MSLSSGASGGKGVDANPVETYDSGDEWDIGVGNLIIDLDADLEKDQQKLEMSAAKEVGLPAPNAVATLPDNIKFVTPVPGPQGKEGKSKSKRSKSGKDAGKPPPGTSLFTPGEGAAGKKESQGRSGDGPGVVAATAPKASEKVAKASRGIAGAKKEKEGGLAKAKKERSEVAGSGSDKDTGGLQPGTLGGRGGQYDSAGVDTGPTEPLGSIAIEPGTALNPLGVKPEPEEGAGECRPLKKVKSEKMESPSAAPAVLPLHLLVPVVSADISSPCEQIMVRTRSVGVNTCDVALATEPECLGPCEPGTSVNLEGIVWQETEDGMLVVNVTWRNKTYVGTLLDCTRHAWAPPRFCDSPTSDLEMRNGRGRGKRVRPGSNTPVSEAAAAPDGKAGGGGGGGSGGGGSKTRAGASSKGRRGSQTVEQRPVGAAAEDAKASPSAGKRKSKPPSDLELTSSSEDSKGGKRVRTGSLGSAGGAAPPGGPTVLGGPGGSGGPKAEPTQPDRGCASPVLIDCPHPNCSKKYKHINGLKYHQAHAHTDEGGKAEVDADSEGAEEPPADAGPKGPLSPARSATPKARPAEPHSPSPSGKPGAKGLCKRRPGADGEPDPGALSNDGSDDVPSAADDTSQDAFEAGDRKGGGDRDRCKKTSAAGPKPDKGAAAKGLKPARPIAPALPPQPVYAFQATAFTGAGASPGLGAAVVQAVPGSPQLKPIQPKPTVMGEPFSVSPALTPAKDKKKKDKKKKEPPREAEGPPTPGKAGRPEEGRSPFREAPGGGSDGLLNGAADPLQSRLASIKAEADKVYSFSDNAPSPSIGAAAGRLEGPPPAAPALAPLNVVTQNGAEAGAAKTSSPAYSDISDAGEDGEARADGGSKARELPEMPGKEGAKKALFPPPPPGKEAPYYAGYETYYSPGYAQASPGTLNPAAVAPAESPGLKAKKDEEPEGPAEAKTKGAEGGYEDKKVELGPSPQPSVIQQRPGVYMQSLYYNQYAYVPPYSYGEQAYHAHLLHRPPCDDPQKRPGLERKDDWKPRPAGPPTLTRAPSLTDLAKAGPGKAKEPGTAAPAAPAAAAEPAKSVIIPKLDEASTKLPGQVPPDGPKNKLGEAGHLGKDGPEPKAGAECGRQPEADPILWYRQPQEAEPRMWTYVYPAKYADVKAEDERWKEEQRERKVKEERARAAKDPAGPKEDSGGGKDGPGSEGGKLPLAEETRLGAKEPRPGAHVPSSSPLGQHQTSYLPYMHGFSYSQAYDPGQPSYRGVPAVMMQNYPGSYLPSSYSFSPFGSKVSGAEDPDKARVSPSVGCKAGESKALDILQQHASHYKSKSPTMSDKTPQERDRAGCGGAGAGGGCSSVAPAAGGERSADRPRTSPSQRLMSTHHHHHHLGYSLLPAQYNLPYAAGLSSTAMVASQQGSAPSLYPPPRR